LWLGRGRCRGGVGQPGESATSTSRALDGLRILLADDDPDSLDAIAAILEMNGAEVCRCRDGAQARALMPSFRPHLVVSDLAMPVEDGFEMIAAIRAMSPDQGGQIPAIAFSSVLDPTTRSLALRCGYQEFVSKPVNVPLLLTTILSVAAGRLGPP
jgi:two-component system, chemotaxis family, CheB/CheR fusion protein